MNLGPSHSQHEPSVDDYSVQLDSLMFARSPAGCAAYILGSIFYAATLNSRGALNNSGFAFVSILVLTSTIRLFLAIRGQRNMALDLDYKTVKGIHRIAIITMGLIWTAWVALVQSRYGSLSPESFIGMIFSLSLAAGAINSLASQRNLLMIQHVIIVGGVGISTTIHETNDLGGVLGVLILIFLSFMLQQTVVQYRTLTDNIKFRLFAEKEASKTVSVLNATPGYLAILDENGKSIHISPALTSLLKKQADQLDIGNFGPALADIIGSFLKQSAMTMTREIAPGEPFSDRKYMVTLVKTGTPINGFAIHMLDITRQKNSEAQLDDMRRQAEHASRLAALGEMVGSVAHEIRNPLTIIDGRANFLKLVAGKGNISAPSVAVEMESISKMVHRINKIIGGVLKFSHGQMSHAFEPCSLNQLLEEVSSLLASKLKTNDVELRGLDQVPTLSLECQPIQISQVLVNLVGNAIDAIEKCSEKWVDIKVIDQPEKIMLRIADSGPGIPADLREKIMQPFFTTKGVGKGTGLGLSISRGIIASHKGSLTIDEHAPNTTFVIELWKVIPVSDKDPQNPQAA